MKPTKRKGFNFLRSYFDVLNEIPKDSDKLEFLMAVINKQFLDEDPNGLGFVAKLSYESQRHSIEQSVKGYKDKMKTDVLGNPLKAPYVGGRQGGCKGPRQQEKEKEKEQQNKDVDFKTLLVKNKNEHGQWVESLYMKFKFKNGSLGKLLEQYDLTVKNYERKHQDLKDYKNNFVNWLNKMDGMQKLNDHKR